MEEIHYSSLLSKSKGTAVAIALLLTAIWLVGLAVGIAHFPPKSLLDWGMFGVTLVMILDAVLLFANPSVNRIIRKNRRKRERQFAETMMESYASSYAQIMRRMLEEFPTISEALKNRAAADRANAHTQWLRDMIELYDAGDWRSMLEQFIARYPNQNKVQLISTLHTTFEEFQELAGLSD